MGRACSVDRFPLWTQPAPRAEPRVEIARVDGACSVDGAEHVDGTCSMESYEGRAVDHGPSPA